MVNAILDLSRWYSPFFFKSNSLNSSNNYSDKFTLSVVNLNQIKMATEEDKVYKIDYWAAIFKAKTWEELRMMAKDNEYLQEAAESLYVANADEIVRQQCRAREDAERRERTLERAKRLAEEALEKERKEKELVIKEKESAIKEIEKLKELLIKNGIIEAQ